MQAFDTQPLLGDGHIALRGLAATDLDALYAVASDPELWAGHPMRDRWQRAVFERFFTDAMDSGSALLATDAASGAVIGSSRYDRRWAGEREIEIGWTFLARERWGTGANPAMKRLMLAHAFTAFEQVIFVIGETNIRSRTAIERIGGRLTDRAFEAGERGFGVRHLVYAIAAGDFRTGPLAGAGHSGRKSGTDR